MSSCCADGFQREREREHANIPTLASNKACDAYSPAHDDQSIEKHAASLAASCCIKAQNFDCNICLDGCHDPVVTHCGHLFCWPCLYSWLSLHSGSKECPICRANVQDKIVPLYAGGGGGRAQQSTNSAARMFPGMHNIPSRPLPSRSHVPADVAANAVTHLHDDVDNHERNRVAIQDYEIHTRTSARHAAANAGFLASMLRCGMTSLAAYSGRGFLRDDQRRRAQYYNGASTVAPRQRQRQRFSNEKEFVLHWAFIFVASIAIVCFIVSSS